ncbi:hypothetical protein Vafri_8818 [Volvox africanus]|uniref:Uncharacterized protein n=1 Tax=Volvox africanus TaxID=51714 RepID=A0A8J4B7N1_9CHLO|nr:hypothetical protein Vafri_8818 [Volvox africanus]
MNDARTAFALGASHNSPRALLHVANGAGNGMNTDAVSGAVHLDHDCDASGSCSGTRDHRSIIDGAGDDAHGCRDFENSNSSGALVCLSERSWALAELNAPPPDANQVLARRAVLEERRAAAERHYYRDVWVKDPHGGPYRKAVSTRGRGSRTGPLAVATEHQRPTEPGYEVVEVGPTTNFVGNAMSTSAVDLVMAQLEQLRGRWSPPSSSSHHRLMGSTYGAVAAPALPAPLPSPVPSPIVTGSCDAAALAAATAVASTATICHTNNGHSGCGDKCIASSAPEASAGAAYGSGSAVGDFPGGTELRQVGAGLIVPDAGCPPVADACLGSGTGSEAASETSGVVDPWIDDRMESHSQYGGVLAESEEVRSDNLRRRARRLMGRMRGTI